MGYDRTTSEGLAKARASCNRWYARNSHHVMDNTRRRLKKIKTWFRNYKETLQCKKCSENRIACLDFHHKDPKKKDRSIAKCIHDGWSIERIKKEIKKCDVMCSNCHRVLHFYLEDS